MKTSLIEPLEARIAPAVFAFKIIPGGYATVEGNDPLQTHFLDFTVELSAAATTDATVDFTTKDGTATVADNDYDLTSGTLVIPAGETTGIIHVPVRGDTVFEGKETFKVELSNASPGNTINPIPTRKTATGTILNDDAGPVPTVSIADALPFDEADAGLDGTRFRVTLSNESLSTVTVVATTMIQVGDTATSGADFTAKTETVTFAPGETSKDFVVTIINDLIHEPGETFHVVLSGPTNATLGTMAEATGTITSDDAVPTVSVDSVSILEGDGAKSATFTVTLSNPSSSVVSVTATSAAGGLNPATAGSDFTAATRVLTFNPGGPLTQTFLVPILGDTIPEADETFTVTLSGESNATLGTSVGTGTILNDESVFIDASTVDVRVLEGDAATKTMNFTVKLGKVYSQVVTIMATTTPGTATPGSDFTPFSQLLTFNPGETTKTVSVPIRGDLNDEGDETFFLDLSNPSANALLGASHAAGTILNDEARLSVQDVAVSETNAGTTLTFNVTLFQASNHPVTVNFATQDGTAISTGTGKDFDAQAGTLTFAAGVTTMPVIIVVNGDTVGELDENFFLKLTNATGALLLRDTATGTILNDEATLRISDAQVLEGGVNGVTQAVFTVTLANGPASENVTVNVGTGTTGTATAGTDFTALVAASNTLTFLPGETSKQVMVTITGDTATEQNETFPVTLSGQSANVQLARATGTGTILNDDGTALTINDVTVTEGDAGTLNAVFLVRLLNAATQPVTVDVVVEAGTATAGDFTPFSPVTRTLTFNTGITQQLVTVPIVGDLIQEGTETFTLRLSNATGGATIAKSGGIGTILDNGDAAPLVSIGNGRLVEGNGGTSMMEFTATLSQMSQGTVTAAYSTRDLTGAAHPATANVDYTRVPGGMVVFAPGQTSVLISVPIIGDAVNEFDETFGITLSAPSGATLGTADGIGTIQNDEVTISIDDVSISEGTGGTTTYSFHVALTTPGGAALQGAVTVDFATADGTAISTGATSDFTTRSGTLTFAAGAVGAALTQVVTISVAGDSRSESDEQFFVNLLSSTNATIVNGKGTGTIQNDDAVQISIGDAAFTEGATGGNMIFTVTLDKASDSPVTVKVNTVDGTAMKSVTAGTPPVTTLKDFTGITDQTITFNPGETSKTVSVNVVNDAIDEAKTETFRVELSAPTGATVLDGAGTGTITDDDLRTLSVSDVSIIEGDSGTSEVTFTVALSSVSSQVVHFDYGTGDSTATAGLDYEASPGSASIPIGETTAQVKVLVKGDTTSEVNERFLFNLLSSPDANISTTAGAATATIVDDEAGGARLELVPVSGVAFAEADRVVEFNVVRTGNLSRAVTVQYETVDDTAKSAGAVSDFVAKSGTVTFAAGSTTASETIRVRILGDINYENEEKFQVRLFNPVNAAVLNGGTPDIESRTDITIHEDVTDLVPTLKISDARIVEGNSASQQLVFKVGLFAPNGMPATNEKDVVTVRADSANGLDPATAANSTGGLPAKTQDYVATASQGVNLTFNPGDLTRDVSITVNGDTRDEPDEEFLRVLLSAGNKAQITDGEALGTIVDDDAAPTLRLSGPTGTITEGDTGTTNAVFTVTLSSVSERPISVHVTTQPGTAVSSGLGADFQALDMVANSDASSQNPSFNFTVLVNGDTLDEANESFGVTIGDPINGTIAGGTASVTATIADNDVAPVVFVNDANIVEGDSGSKELVFTVSLSAASGQTVDVNFATQDGTAQTTGLMADFVAKSGALKFIEGETQKEVRIVINGDTFKEHDETLSLQISSPVNATILTPTGTGTIQTDGDTTVGIAIRTAFGVEGDSSRPTISFTVDLSDTLAAATTFGAVATSGTATRGVDFAPLANSVFTIAPNTKTATVPVTVNGDTTFEGTEHFFVGLRNVVNAGENITIVSGTARGTIFNDDIRLVNARTIQFIDVDGDLATVRVSKGALTLDRLSFGATNSIGGRQLQAIILTGNNRQFQDADLSVTATAQAGFRGDANGKMGNGFVNVGAISAAVDQGILQFANGIDLGTVTIDGDLGKIHVGDTTATSAINSLVVRSIGRFGTTTQGAGGSDTLSRVLGPIDSLRVFGNFQGTMQVVGEQFGIIRNLQIDGALMGGSQQGSGQIFFTGRIDNAQIGQIVGGSGANSALLIGSSTRLSKITNLHVIGAVRGGAGDGSGVVSVVTLGTARIGAVLGGEGTGSGQVAPTDTLDRIVVSGDIVGGDGDRSGEVFANRVLGTVRVLGEVRGGGGASSGLIATNGSATNISVFGSIFGGDGALSGGIVVNVAIANVQTGALVGGDGENSGLIRTGGIIQKLNVNGNVQGGSGAGSGGVDVGGKLLSGVISGSIVGGDSKGSTSLVKSGYVVAHRLQNLTVGGNLESGKNAGTGLALSGTIRSETTIDSVRIRGSVLGSADVAAIIAAPGDASGAAIRSLRIDGFVQFAEILGGYGVDGTAANPRGTAKNADAAIGTVSFGGDLLSTSIIAGAVAGPDGLFGTIDDFPIGGAGAVNAAGTVSRIANIIIEGSVRAGTRSCGIEAQFVQAVSVNGSVFTLLPGAGNDGAPGAELVTGSKIRVFEVPVV